MSESKRVKRMYPFPYKYGNTNRVFNKVLKRTSSSDVLTKKLNFRKVLENSSVYAVSQIPSSRYKNRKYIWTLILVCALLGCSYHIYEFGKIYFKYPVVVNLEIEQPESLDFPAVTVCNQNRVVEKFRDCLYDIQSFEDCVEKIILEESRNETSVPEPYVGRPITFFVMSERRMISSCGNNKYEYEENNKKTYHKFQFLSSFMQLSEQQRDMIGHQSKQFIQYCSFNGEVCSSQDFKTFQSIRYGNCFTFRSKNDNSSINTRSGILAPILSPNKGLELILNMDLLGYIHHTELIGSRVIVHNPIDEPNPEENGIDVNSGFETSIAVSESQMKRLPYPYKDECRSYGLNTISNYTNQFDCVKRCIQDRSWAKCGCTDSTLPKIKEAEHCDLLNVTQMCCLDESMASLSADGKSCLCPYPCISASYKQIVSLAAWPSEAYFLKIKNINDHLAAKWDFHEYKKNFAKVNVFRSNSPRKIFVQSPKFIYSELLGFLGSELGLWLGLSMFVLFELCEIAFNLCERLRYHVRVTML